MQLLPSYGKYMQNLGISRMPEGFVQNKDFDKPNAVV